MKDLLVSIATIDKTINKSSTGLTGPERLDRTLHMLYDNCYSINNFDIQIIINDIQIHLYQNIIDKWNITPSIIKYSETWDTLIEAQNMKMQEGYYFFVFFPDDVYGMNKDWDKHIIDKKNSFDDDLFVVFSTFKLWGRKTEILVNCYDSLDSAFSCFEQNPVWTYKFGEFMYNLFSSNKYVKGREILIAFLLHLLRKKGYNRHILSDYHYEKVHCTTNNTKKIYPEMINIVNKDGVQLEKIVNKMIDYIQRFKLNTIKKYDS